MPSEPGSEDGGEHSAVPGFLEPAELDIGIVPGGRALARLCRGLALAGGVLLLVAVGITLVSVSGRYALGEPVPGDYELVEIVCAVAVFLFFPFTHVAGGNITAEFFTSGLPVRWCRALDVVHDAIFTALAALLAWRLGHGLVDKYENGDMSLLIRIPLWWPYSFAVACMALLALVCAWRLAANILMLRR